MQHVLDAASALASATTDKTTLLSLTQLVLWHMTQHSSTQHLSGAAQQQHRCQCRTTESIPHQCWYLNQDQVQCEPTGISHRRLLSSIKCSSKELRHCDTGRHGSRRLHTDEQCTRSHLQTSCCACTRNRRIPAACVDVKKTLVFKTHRAGVAHLQLHVEREGGREQHQSPTDMPCCC